MVCLHHKIGLKLDAIKHAMRGSQLINYLFIYLLFSDFGACTMFKPILP